MYRTLPDRVHCMDRWLQVDVMSLMHLFDSLLVRGWNHRIIELSRDYLPSALLLHSCGCSSKPQRSIFIFLMRNVLWGMVLPPPHINVSCYGKLSQTQAIAAVWALIHTVAAPYFSWILLYLTPSLSDCPATGLCIWRPVFKLLCNPVNM